VSDRTDEIYVPLVRSDAFVDERHVIRNVITVSAEEGFLPVEFVFWGLIKERNDPVGVLWIGV